MLSVEKRDFRRYIWLKRASQERKYRNQPRNWFRIGCYIVSSVGKVLIKLKKEKQKISLEELKGDSEVDAFIAESGGTIDIDADGPWGRYQRLEDAKIFEKIAEAAPSASFYGKTEGGTSYTTENIEGELKNGILHLESFFEANEESDEEYYSFLSKKMPLERFIEVFKIDEEEFDEDSYEEYLTDSTCYDSFMREDYDEFIECCEAAGINKTEYKTLKKQFSKEGLDWEVQIPDFAVCDFR